MLEILLYHCSQWRASVYICVLKKFMFIYLLRDFLEGLALQRDNYMQTYSRRSDNVHEMLHYICLHTRVCLYVKCCTIKNSFFLYNCIIFIWSFFCLICWCSWMVFNVTTYIALDGMNPSSSPGEVNSVQFLKRKDGCFRGGFRIEQSSKHIYRVILCGCFCSDLWLKG